MSDPGESKVTICPLATITDSCFYMQMYLFSNFNVITHVTE